MSDKTELLPCPFCGGKAHWPEPEVNIHYVGCMSCAACATGVEDWNRRTALAEQPAPVNKSVIRDVFLRNGFTIKEGQTDLKPYVYAAAEELLSLDGKAVAAAPAAPVAQEPERELVGYACDRRGALIQERCGDCLCWPAYENVATPSAEQPDTVAVPRELLEELADIADAMQCYDARDDAIALLGKESEA